MDDPAGMHWRVVEKNLKTNIWRVANPPYQLF
jgi:hypothetical protein